jgi:hypothetical protein
MNQISFADAWQEEEGGSGGIPRVSEWVVPCKSLLKVVEPVLVGCVRDPAAAR